MKKYVINYEDRAKNDILNIINYIEKEHDDSYNAVKVAIRIYRRCETLAFFPKGFPVHREWGLKTELRAVHIKGYTIIYYVDEEELAVNIRAVVNSCRDIVPLVKKKWYN